MGLYALESRAEMSAVDPAAVEILKKMTDYLGGAKQFSVHTQNTLEDFTASGDRIDLDVSANVLVSRPNKIRSERKGDLVDQIFYYDGKVMTLFNPANNIYSTVAAPDNFYGLFQYLYESLGIGLPISDLVLSNSFELLMQDVTLAQVVTKTYIDGVKCDHLLFRRPGVNFQIWIADGAEPLPQKYVVTDTATSSQMSISSMMKDWDIEPLFDESQFTFIKPEGAQSINFIQF
jgi:hypothetical protein